RPDARVGVGRASLAIETVRGRAASTWVRDGQHLILVVTVPVGSTADVHVPGSVDDVDGSPIVSMRPLESGWVVARVGSGEWTFRGRIAGDPCVSG
ncbi:MAG: alpha-L-rhamnosidase C-terminal domain-containing protein, partial [Nocardioidaceae bacterium]